MKDDEQTAVNVRDIKNVSHIQVCNYACNWYFFKMSPNN